MKNSITKFFRESLAWKYVFLGTVFFVTFFITIFPDNLQKFLYDISFTLVFVLGYINSDRRHPVILPLSIGAVALIWISGYFKLELLFVFSYFLNILFFGMVILTLIKNLAYSKTVTPRLILESIITYLLIGLIFAMIISILDHYDPGAFSHTETPTEKALAHLNDFIYFTFVTLSTTGYGDIIPLKPYARSLTILIAITGQMYLAIIISMLVGKYAATRRSQQDEE